MNVPLIHGLAVAGGAVDHFEGLALVEHGRAGRLAAGGGVAAAAAVAASRTGTATGAEASHKKCLQ